MKPIVDGLESDYGDRIVFERLNVDEPDGRVAAQTYRVRGHPTIVIVDSKGDVVWNRVGVIPTADLMAAIENAMGP
ncbi:MAG: thioredoxin family protein [Caldilineales bacterium]|nr:thioredoxin family protein [Caldilineales bacterium]